MMNNYMADLFFGGTSSSTSGSIFSASNFGDLALMRSGVYTKLLKSYYSNIDEASDTKKSTSDTVTTIRDKVAKEKAAETQNSETNKVLSGLKSAAKTLETDAKSLSEMDFDTTNKEDLYAAVKKVVNSYNSVIDSAGKTDLTSVSQSITWMKTAANSRQTQLNNVGITIGTDGKLSLDEEKFNKARTLDIKSLMSGDSSYVASMSQRATGLYNLAANQISSSTGNTFYSSSGVLK